MGAVSWSVLVVITYLIFALGVIKPVLALIATILAIFLLGMLWFGFMDDKANGR